MKTKDAIIKAAGVTHDQYADHVFNTAIEYLEKILDGDEYQNNLLIKSKLFWEWWKRQWERREFSFIQIHHLEQLSDADLKDVTGIIHDLWCDLHSINSLNIYPNNVVMESTYNEMIGELVGGDERKKGGVK